MVDRVELEAYTDRRLAGLYDLVLTQVWPNRDVAFYVDQLASLRGAVLELGCGTGRVLLPLARAGIEVTGLDSSPAFLDIVRSKLADESPAVAGRVTLVEGRMEEIEIDRRFAAAFIACNSFGHLLDRRSQESCLRAVAAHLEPGGAFYMHVNGSFESISQPTRTPFVFSEEQGCWIGCDDRLVHADPVSGVVELQWIYEFISPGQPYEKVVVPMSLKYTPVAEITEILEGAGLRVREVIRDWQGEPLQDDCVMLISEKRA